MSLSGVTPVVIRAAVDADLLHANIGGATGEYRAQLLIKGMNRKKIREALQAAIAARPELQRRVVVDVDPLSVL